MLPHRYPFLLVDRRDGDGNRPLRWTVNAALDRGGGELPTFLAVEMMAQASLMVLPAAPSPGGSGAPRRGLLAGIEQLRLAGPLRAGEEVRARAELRGRLGRLIKVRVELRQSGELLAEGDLLLALEPGDRSAADP